MSASSSSSSSDSSFFLESSSANNNTGYEIGWHNWLGWERIVSEVDALKVGVKGEWEGWELCDQDQWALMLTKE